MIRIAKYWLARFLRERLQRRIVPSNITEDFSKGFNHLSALVISKGRVRIKWDVVKKAFSDAREMQKDMEKVDY